VHRSHDELRADLVIAGDSIDIDGRYTHYKDPKSQYRVLGFTIIESTDEVAVRYSSEIDRDIEFVRPLNNWLEQIDGVPRFEKLV